MMVLIVGSYFLNFSFPFLFHGRMVLIVGSYFLNFSFPFLFHGSKIEV